VWQGIKLKFGSIIMSHSIALFFTDLCSELIAIAVSFRIYRNRRDCSAPIRGREEQIESAEGRGGKGVLRRLAHRGKESEK
jgi:hypothetical protein